MALRRALALALAAALGLLLPGAPASGEPAVAWNIKGVKV